MAEAVRRVLLVEDDDDDYFLVKDLFEDFPPGTYQLQRVADYDAALDLMQRCAHDVYLVDYRLGAKSGLDLIAESKRHGCHAPLIILTGQTDRESDLLAMQAGAYDYLTKDRLDAALLDRAIRYALQQRRHDEEIHRANQQLEERVAQRTAQLAALNQVLQQQITERCQIEEALREADVRKDEFLAMLAHELRNPLAPLVAGLDLMKLGSQSPSDIEELRAIMSRQVSQLVRLVDDLLDVSRISRGKLQVRRENISLSSVIESAIDLSRPLINIFNHELQLHLPGQLPHVFGDRVRLTQVVGNVLINAAKYTPPGGKIELRVEQHDTEAVIKVRDNGIGIPPEMLGKVFDLFLQVDGSASRAQGGLGIGLTLARTLVEMHGGRIEVISAGAGQGSEFTVALPVVNDQKDSVPHISPDSASETLQAFRVLIVDDNRAAVFLLQRLLQKLGQNVHVVHDPRLAAQSAISLRPEVVISDIAMPEMSGYELARELRELPLQPRPVLIALTGYGQERDRNEARDAGFDFHLTKPAGLTELRDLFATVAREHR